MKDLMRNNDLFWCLCLPIIFGCFVWCWNLSRETAQLKGQLELLQMRVDLETATFDDVPILEDIMKSTVIDTDPPIYYDDYNYQGPHR